MLYGLDEAAVQLEYKAVFPVVVKEDMQLAYLVHSVVFAAVQPEGKCVLGILFKDKVLGDYLGPVILPVSDAVDLGERFVKACDKAAFADAAVLARFVEAPLSRAEKQSVFIFDGCFFME